MPIRRTDQSPLQNPPTPNLFYVQCTNCEHTLQYATHPKTILFPDQNAARSTLTYSSWHTRHAGDFCPKCAKVLFPH